MKKIFIANSFVSYSFGNHYQLKNNEITQSQGENKYIEIEENKLTLINCKWILIPSLEAYQENI